MSVSIFRWAGPLFLFLMLAIPTTFQEPRSILLGALVLFAAWRGISGHWRLHRQPFYIGVACLLTSAFFMSWGAINDAPGAMSVGTVYFLWPLVLLFLAGVNNVNYVDYIKSIILAIIFSSLCGILLVAEGYGVLNTGASNMLQFQGAAVGIYSGTIEYNLYNMTTVIFGFPFLLSLVLLQKRYPIFNDRWTKISLISLTLCIIILFISGRRAFWLIAFLSVPIIFAIFRLSGIKPVFGIERSIYLIPSALALALSVFFTLNLDINVMLSEMESGFEFEDSQTESTSARVLQFKYLMNEWTENPLFGRGHGSFSKHIIRSEEYPWAYELSYVILLFQVGIVGFFVYASAIIWIFLQTIIITRKDKKYSTMIIPLSVGLAGFLIANATNPYLAKFDYLWTIFLPVAIINSFMIKNQSTI